MILQGILEKEYYISDLISHLEKNQRNTRRLAPGARIHARRSQTGKSDSFKSRLHQTSTRTANTYRFVPRRQAGKHRFKSIGPITTLESRKS